MAQQPEKGAALREWWPAVAVALFAIAIWWLTELRLAPPG